MLFVNTVAAIADPDLKQDARDWRDKREWQGLDLRVMQVALFTLVAWHATISQQTVIG